MSDTFSIIHSESNPKPKSPPIVFITDLLMPFLDILYSWNEKLQQLSRDKNLDGVSFGINRFIFHRLMIYNVELRSFIPYGHGTIIVRCFLN